jgi:hypothetical protein
MRSQVGPIVYKSEPIDVMTLDSQRIKLVINPIVVESQIAGTDVDYRDNQITNHNTQTSTYKEHTENPNYLVYNDGRIYSKYSRKFLSASLTSGYYAISLRINTTRSNERVHRLVAFYFVSNPDPIKCTSVNHKDSNKVNNDYRNLEWVTPQYNANHAVNRESYRPSHVSSVRQIGADGNIVNTFDSIVDASKYTGISRSMISHCCGGRAVKSTDSNGVVYRWQFVEETRIDDVPINARSVSGLENYLVTNQGTIYSLRKRGYISQFTTADGYMTVCLKTPTTKVTLMVHRIVADAYLVKDTSRRIVNHKDSNRQNNRVSNLEYVTQKENLLHSCESGNKAKFKKAVQMIDPVERTVLAIFTSITEASKTTRIDRMSISQCCNKKSRLGGGYLWQFEDETAIRGITPKSSSACSVEPVITKTGEIVASMTPAAESTNRDCRRISDICSGKLPEYKGFRSLIHN